MTPPDVDVWLLRIRCQPDESMLSRAENERARTMGSATARRRYVSGRVAVRHAVGERLGLAPADVPLARADGRIHLVDRPDCHVAMSHAADLVAVAVSTHGPIGIDVEAVGRSGQRIPAAALSPPKVAAAAVHVGDRLAPLGVWVAQEAALKADGIGLAFPLSAVTFDLCAGGLLVRLGARSAWGVTLCAMADAVVAVAACGQPPLLHRRMWTEVGRTLAPTGPTADA